ncbi:MAG: response regulator [Flavobacteriales bacterium]|nr:response regulator [Flavobacteriales bacterium]MCB9168420.1 response regulator [Flavobacteriales bacterium]
MEQLPLDQDLDVADQERGLREAFLHFWQLYSERKQGVHTIEDIIPLFAPNVTAIGTGEHEIGDSHSEVIRNFRDDFKEFKGSFALDFFGVRAKVLSPSSGLVEAQCNFEVEVEPGKVLNFYTRFSTVFVLQHGRWLMVHNHLSMPSHEQEEGQAFPIDALKAKNERLEKEVALRTKEVQEKSELLKLEMEKTETLLYNILPEEVAEELRSTGRTEAKHFDRVSILFSDFKGFTDISERLSPGELVDELNICFKAFDRIMEKHGVEKIKTIGDAYMAAGNVPDPGQGDPLDVVMAALEMQEIMHERRAEREAQGHPFFEMRLGIHTGPVVAGIVGLKKFQYDIWGDTVNIASRMESSGEVGKVNISASTHALIAGHPDLVFEPRGHLEVKGKGAMEMYFVRRRDPVPSSNAPGHSGHIDMDPSVDGVLATIDLRGTRILLVEDNDFNSMVAQDELQAAIADVDIELARNGVEALRMVRDHAYDLVLMDVQMPEMNGYDATRAIRALGGRYTDLPIIALTANAMKAEMQRCIDAGMNGTVPKPFEREELLGVLRKALTGRGRSS